MASLQKVGFIVLLVFCNSILQAQQWTTKILAPMPEPVSNNAVCEGFISNNAYVYSFAGIDSTKAFDGIHLRSFRYDVNANRWDTLPPLPDTLGKIAASASRVGEIIYIIGGYHVFADDTERSSNRVHRFDIVSNTYLSDGAPIPVPIDDQVQFVWQDSLIIVVTGWSDDGNVSDVQIYDPSKDEWRAGDRPSARSRFRSFGASGVILEDTIYYYGGANDGFGFSVQEYLIKGSINEPDFSDIDWDDFELDPPRPGYRMASTVIDGKPRWIGGSKETYNYNGLAYSDDSGVEPANRILTYDPNDDQWSEDDVILPMDLRGIAVIDSATFILAGGITSAQTVSNQTIQLEFSKLSNLPSTSTFEFDLTIFPNPASEQIQLTYQLSKQKKIQYQLINAAGIKTNISGELEGASTSLSITHLPAGTYTLKLIDERGYIFSRQFSKM